MDRPADHTGSKLPVAPPATFIARYRRQNGGKQKDVLEVDADITETLEAVYGAKPTKPWLRLDNPFLWEER